MFGHVELFNCMQNQYAMHIMHLHDLYEIVVLLSRMWITGLFYQ